MVVGLTLSDLAQILHEIRRRTILWQVFDNVRKSTSSLHSDGRRAWYSYVSHIDEKPFRETGREIGNHQEIKWDKKEVGKKEKKKEQKLAVRTTPNQFLVTHDPQPSSSSKPSPNTRDRKTKRKQKESKG